ncbi:MAG: hypothetical protein EXR51_04730 [Dehalococcoidia bacterium]|nr:hypothetical protein [Dehalococcoidia bacterium]
MCEHCDETRMWKEKIDLEEVEEDENFCEWTEDQEGDQDEADLELDEADDEELAAVPACSEAAVWWVYDEWVESHLCLEHMRLTERDLQAGLAALMEEVAAVESYEFLTVRKPGDAVCEYVRVENIIRGGEVPECGRPATHAKRVVDVQGLCEAHTVAYLAGG